jgi:tetratricopeptide (TPR) repeat protein
MQNENLIHHWTLEQCQEWLKSADQSDGERSQVFGRQARLLLELGQYDAAIASYNQAIKLAFTSSAQLWTERGDALRYLKRYRQALQSYNTALTVAPEHFKALNGQGFVLAMLGRRKEALASSDRALALQPDSEEVWASRGVVLFRLGRHQEALGCFDRALELHPNFDKAWNNRGVVLTHLGREEEALVCFEQAVTLNTNSHEPWYALAWVHQAYLLMKLGRFAGAIAHCDRALACRPQLYPAALYRVVCLVLTGKMIPYLLQAKHRSQVCQNLQTIVGFLKYRLLILLGVIALFAWGQGAWVDTLRQIVPTLLSLAIIAILVIEIWKYRTKLSFVWQIYFRTGILTYVRAIAILIATVTTYGFANAYAPSFLQWGWANLVFGQPGNILFQPFNLFQNISTHFNLSPHPGSALLLEMNLVAWINLVPGAIAALSRFLPDSIHYAHLFILGFWFLLILGIPFWARLEERIFRRGAHTWRQITIRSTQFGLIHLLAGIPILGGLVLILPGFLFACRYKHAHDRHLKRTHNPIQAQEVGVMASTADHAVYNAILVTLVVVSFFML